jgi:hypothetical protein
MSDLNLHFDGPFTFANETKSVFSCPWVDSAGIYLWTIRQLRDKTHLVHYVGETSRLGKRHREHLIQVLGLNYGIFDCDDAEEGVCTVVWNGLWREKNIQATKHAVTEYERLHEKIVHYINAVTIFFAELPVESQLRKHVEGCIGWNLRNNHADCKQLYPDDNHVGTMTGKTHGRVLLPRLRKYTDLTFQSNIESNRSTDTYRRPPHPISEPRHSKSRLSKTP